MRDDILELVSECFVSTLWQLSDISLGLLCNSVLHLTSVGCTEAGGTICSRDLRMSWDADTYSISASLVDFSKISGYVIPFSNSGITSQFSGLSSAFEEQLSRDELSDAVLSKLFLL